MSTRGDVTYRATDDGAMVEERLDIDAETSLPLIRTRRVPTQPNQVASTPRGESSEEKAEEQAERQAVTHAAQLAVEEEKLLKGLELLNNRREETQHKLEDSEEQLAALNDPARGHQLQDLQMKSARAERVQFEKSQEASDFKLEAERHLEQAKDKGLIKQAAQAKLDGVDRPELGIVIDGDVTQENVDQLAKVESVLSDQAAEAGAKADIAEASMHVAEDEYNDAQAKIAKIESDVPAYGKEKVEEMIKLNRDKVEDLDRATAGLEEKCAEATKRSQRAQKEAVELLRSREKRKEANKRAAAATNHAREQEAAAQEQAKQRKEQNDKAESDRQAAALERRQQMAEREAELSKQAEEQRRALEEEFQTQEHYEPVSTPRDVARNKLGLTPREAIAMNTRRTTPGRQARQPPQPQAREQPQQAVIGKDTNIGVWLRSMRMAQYEEQFLAWGMSTLGKLIDNSEWLTESDLKEMGVVLAHRKSILQCIRAVAAIMNKAGSDTPAAFAETPAGGRATPRAVCKTSAAVPLTQEQTSVLNEMYEAYAPTGELSEMGFSSLFLEAMAYSLLSKECLSVTAPHVRRWVRNRELCEGIDMSSNLVLRRLFDFVDSEGTGSISLESAQEGISQMWAGAADGWQYLNFLTTAGDDLEASAICEFVISLCRFIVELATNVTVLERCHLEANGMPTDRAAQKLKELKKELNTTEGALKRHSDAIMRILGRGRDGELPAPYRRLDELIKSMLSQDLSVIHASITNAPATPRGQKPKRAKNPASNNAFTDTVNTMLENRLAEVEKERATRKGQRDQNKQVNSPRCRLMPISVKLRRNTGKLDQKVIECAGITTDQLIADMNKKLGFQFSKLYSMMGVEVNPHSIARSMELVASAGDPFIHPEAPAGPPKSILQSAALHSSAPMNSPRVGCSPSRLRPGQASPARGRKSESSPARVRTPRAVSGGIQIVFTASQADEGSEASALPPTPSRREPKSVRKAPLPAVFGGGGRTNRDPSPGPADRPPPPPPPLPESARNEAGSAADPSPLAAPVPRSAIRWASAARLQPGEWSDSRNIRRGVTMGRAS